MSKRDRSFLVTLLVIFLLSVLVVAVLLPSLGAARRNARAMSAASDFRQASIDWQSDLLVADSGAIAHSRAGLTATSSGQAGGADSGDGLVIPDARMIARHAKFTLRVDGVGDFVRDVGQIAQDAGGYVTEASHSPGHGRRDEGSIRVCVPSDGLDAVLGEVRGLASEVVREEVEAEDVTDSVVDMEARLTNLRAAEERLREILADVKTQEGSASAVIEVFRELTSLRDQVERLDAKQRTLRQRVRYATVSIRVLGPDAPQTAVTGPEMGSAQAWDYAVSTLVASLRWLLNAVIFVGVAVLPIVAVIVIPVGVVGWVIRKVWRRGAAAG